MEENCDMGLILVRQDTAKATIIIITAGLEIKFSWIGLVVFFVDNFLKMGQLQFPPSKILVPLTTPPATCAWHPSHMMYIHVHVVTTALQI